MSQDHDLPLVVQPNGVLPCHPVHYKDATWRQLASALAGEVLAWAATPGDHGGNPYTKSMVRLAGQIRERVQE